MRTLNESFKDHEINEKDTNSELKIHNKKLFSIFWIMSTTVENWQEMCQAIDQNWNLD